MREASVNTTGAQEWWDISIADCRGSCGVLPMVIFNDKVSPPSLGFLAGYGYTAFIPFMRCSAGFYCIRCQLDWKTFDFLIVPVLYVPEYSYKHVSPPPPGSWVFTCRWFWSLASLCGAFSARSLTPSCLKNCHVWTASSNYAWTFSWCGKLENWSRRKSFTPNSSSSIALQRPWSSGLEKRMKNETVL